MKNRLVHHTLGNGQFMAFYDAGAHIVCAQTILDGQNCVQEVERVLAALHKERRPICIGIPSDAAHDEVVVVEGHKPSRSQPNKVQAEYVAKRIIAQLEQSKTPCVLPGILTARFGCQEAM